MDLLILNWAIGKAASSKLNTFKTLEYISSKFPCISSSIHMKNNLKNDQV